MRAICYVSTACWQLDDSELEHLLQAARTRNREHGITGLLLYCEGSFMQYLEGPKADIAPVWDIIRADEKHNHIITLFDRTVPARLYSDWTMAYRRTEPPDFAKLLNSDWATSSEGTPEQCWFVPGVRMLRDFWELNQTMPAGRAPPPASGAGAARRR
ncbi:MAG: hypothetical protein K0S16_2201 [Moraxellaceae bacterium]|jgi:hypothetical protein|nr:hypothetical protein [Moraxellaceae bacterium]